MHQAVSYLIDPSPGSSITQDGQCMVTNPVAVTSPSVLELQGITAHPICSPVTWCTPPKRELIQNPPYWPSLFESVINTSVSHLAITLLMFVLSFPGCPRLPCLWLSPWPPKLQWLSPQELPVPQPPNRPSSSTSPLCVPSHSFWVMKAGPPQGHHTPHARLQSCCLSSAPVLGWKVCCCLCSQTLLP